MRRRLSSRQLEGWLDLLTGTTEGTIKLVNLCLSETHRLVSESKVRSFLANCVSLNATTANSALDHFLYVCDRDDKYFALFRVTRRSIAASSVFSTTMGAPTFHQFILGRPKTRVKRVIPIAPKTPGDVHQENIYRVALANATSHKGWHQPTSTLGKPHPDPRRVWFTDLSRLIAVTAVDPAKVTEATKVRDVLGLIDTKENSYLLSIQFLARALRSQKKLKIARPVFADQGNRRFAVYLGRAAEAEYRRKWGVTLHLGKLKGATKSAVQGAPERVCSPVSLSTITDSVTVMPLGWVQGTRGEQTGVDDDSIFIKRLRGRRGLESMKKQLLMHADKP